MAIPVARVHLKVAHAALPALLPTPPKWNMLPLLQTPCVAAILPNPLAKPSRADSGERWDAHKAKPAWPESSASSSSVSASSVRSCAGRRGSSWNWKSATSPRPKPGRADSVERWDAHKKPPASPASSSSSSGSSSPASSSKWPISRAASADRWDVYEKRCPPQAELLDDGESSSSDIDDDTEEEILWKPRAMYAGPGFAAAAPEPSMLPVPTGFLVRVA